MLRINFHPTFWVLAFVMIFQGKYVYLAGTVLAAIIHEFGHARAAYHAGYMLEKVTIMPYGAVLYGGEKIAEKDAFRIAIAGPMVSLLMAVITTALWWIFPAVYPYTHGFWKINMALCLFNLLPVYPLDGGRIVIALANSPLKALKIMRKLGIVLSGVMLVLFIITAFYKINYSLGIMSVMIYISATSGTEKESYKHIARSASYLKDWTQPILHRRWTVNHNLKLIELLKMIKSNQTATFDIVDDKGNKIKSLSEEQLGDLCIKHNLRSSLKEHIYN